MFISLAVLALIDSTSFGTLLIPILFLMLPGRTRIFSVMVYLLTVYVAYFAIGAALMHGADLVVERYSSYFESNNFMFVLFGIGVALFVFSFRYTRKQIEKRLEKNKGKLSRMSKWRSKIFENKGDGAFAKSVISVVGLALTAVAVEVITMMPYLSAIGIIKGNHITASSGIGILAGYCAIMILPAILLTIVRSFFFHKIENYLNRIYNWFEREGEYTFGWLLGAVGVMIMLNTASFFLQT